jgi:hypothetical protein
MNHIMSTVTEVDGKAEVARQSPVFAGNSLPGNGDAKAGGSGRSVSRDRLGLALFLVILSITAAVDSWALDDSFSESPPAWEALLWGGKVSVDEPNKAEAGPERSAIQGSDTSTAPEAIPPETAAPVPKEEPASLWRISIDTVTQSVAPSWESHPADPGLAHRSEALAGGFSLMPYRVLELRNIPPLYTNPALPGEGVWQSQDLPVGKKGWPVMYKTSYRPSVDYPNAIVHMVLFDMKQLSMRLYLGSAEPGAFKGASAIEQEEMPRLLAVTNAMWKQRHSGEAGTIFRGEVVKHMAPGVASLVIYKDGSVDILEWNEGIPTALIRDAKQLRHLIVKDGKVVTSVIAGGKPSDSEIGLGFLLSEQENPSPSYSYWGGFWNRGPETNDGQEWFIATRSAFGIRPDGNLVFAVGHHISTKDLAKAMALAGCDRAIHGDANPHNVLGNLYYNDGNGNIVKKVKLSPDQKDYTLDRYLGRSYTSDFFGFFVRDEKRDAS